MTENEAVLEFVKNIAAGQQRIEKKLDDTLEAHKRDDETAHQAIGNRLTSLENSRLAARVVLTTAIAGSTAGAAKLGIIAKILEALGAS